MYRFNCENLDPRQIAYSGQTFRWKETPDGGFIIPAFGREVTLRRVKDSFELSCDEKEWDEIWYSYFDMDTDYKKIGRIIKASGDEYLKKAYSFGQGIRILRQDPWEMIVCFMISQNNNIPRIRGSVEKICARCTKNGAFPSAGEIDPDIFDDATLGLGYRAPYLKEMVIYCQNNPGLTDELKAMDSDEAMKYLMSFKGIGTKVASCILLFGLHRVDAFPIDTHIKKILAAHYPDGFDRSFCEGFSGIVQQYMFYYDLTDRG